MKKRISKGVHAVKPDALLIGVCSILFCVIAQADEAAGFSGLTVANSAELDEMRGMNGDTRITVQSRQDLDATVTGSSFSAGTINGGSVTFAEHSLDNFSGIGLFNIVTGNNNAVDSAVGVTFNLQ